MEDQKDLLAVMPVDGGPPPWAKRLQPHLHLSHSMVDSTSDCLVRKPWATIASCTNALYRANQRNTAFVTVGILLNTFSTSNIEEQQKKKKGNEPDFNGELHFAFRSQKVLCITSCAPNTYQHLVKTSAIPNTESLGCPPPLFPLPRLLLLSLFLLLLLQPLGLGIFFYHNFQFLLPLHFNFFLKLLRSFAFVSELLAQERGSDEDEEPCPENSDAPVGLEVQLGVENAEEGRVALAPALMLLWVPHYTTHCHE
eukprot:TRINITY_DN4669_c0_g1_i2.p1 TRINITY_DN4669_c0_g1~~TRINITY_DN4669_c0_g1_i2.p1  ORF type:complete len:254 (+),score=35.81 TRINITY_DN4669_c0_g1_i2:547-1308(+)